MSVALATAVEQLRMLRAGEISPVELAEEHIGRIARLDPALNAMVDFDAERVRVQARQAVAGPLSGLPVTIKSSIGVAGHRCEVGSRLWRGRMAAGDAVAVGRLRAAGAVILGTTNCPEFLMAYETDNLLNGRTSNPWDLARTPGGSSGGEAAAIAAGMSAGGLGSDAGGSVREPAGFSGICALKPTPGRISPVGHVPGNGGPFSTLASIGPMARTIKDVALLFGVASGVAVRPVGLDELRRVRVGWFEDDGLIPVAAEVRRAVREAAAALKEAGFEVRAYRPEGLEDARRLWDVFFVQCGAMLDELEIAGMLGAWEPMSRRRDMGHLAQIAFGNDNQKGEDDGWEKPLEVSPVFLDFLAQAGRRVPLTAESLLLAWMEMDAVQARVLAGMESCPVLLTPVCAVPAFRHGERSWMVEGRRLEYLDAMRFTQWFNLLGAPAAVVPVGRSAEGLPIGVQVAGRPGEDELVLGVAGVLDRAFGYRVPPMAG